ncbi:monodechloroaminopyrrolnitrin synthase PrnB family protein [Roseivirga sp. BDSF3-8]|uniref:monodechloroaminopyrrolnitrin synthase PrnB family protein n=1 Tax=Roseivirga sp. BDSF3-8 TaxID=3241598 RepID=UPI003531FAA6
MTPTNLEKAFPDTKSFLDTIHQDEQIIGQTDVLGADEWIKKIPVFNNEGNVEGLINILKDALPTPETAEKYTYHEAAAAMRDLGILFGSIKRHGEEPETHVPNLADTMMVLSKTLDLPPRDTLISYSVWNPQGSRLRTYTGTADEMNLIYSVQMSMNPLVKAILLLDKLYHMSFEDPEFAPLCRETAENFQAMVKGVVHAKRHVAPEVFAGSLRFYFDPIQLDGKTYLGPGAVEMPVFVFDHILWSSDCTNEEYLGFKETYHPYVLPKMRQVYNAYNNKPSLLTRFSLFLENSDQSNPVVRENIKAMEFLCTQLKSFRMPHKKVAENAYHKTPKAQRSKGSGGYAPTMLTHIINLNLRQIEKFKKSSKKYTEQKAAVMV